MVIKLAFAVISCFKNLIYHWNHLDTKTLMPYTENAGEPDPGGQLLVRLSEQVTVTLEVERLPVTFILKSKN